MCGTVRTDEVVLKVDLESSKEILLWHLGWRDKRDDISSA